MQHSDILVAIFILCVIVMLVIPLPPLFIDLSIALNLTLAMVIILSVTYLKKATEFSIFPSLLLITTVYRLAIEVSTSRIILNGMGADIGIVRTFGTFVVGGNIVVGIVIFLILTIIQLLVIVRGTMRVSEVAARFTLDAMPGRQMAIDADLNAGYITEKEAADKRVEIRKEADFYGAMDGSARFVQGDVIASIVIAAINIIGGLTIGVLMRGEALGDAFRDYTTYTVGCALSAQIPAFLISVSTGLIVARAATQENLGTDFAKQLTSQPRVLWIATGALLFFLLTPLPKIPLLFVGGVLGSLAYLMSKTVTTEEKKTLEEKKKKELEWLKKPESVASLLVMDPMELEIGYALIPLVDPEQGGDLLDRVTMIRRQTALELGIVTPPIRIRDNIQLKPNTYSIKIRGLEVGKGTIKLDRYLAMNPGRATEQIEGEPTVEPVYNSSATWIKEDMREYAEQLKYTVVDPPTIISTHIQEIIKRHAPDLITRQDVQSLMDSLKQNNPTVVAELIPGQLTLGEVQKVLHNLLRQGISIRDLLTITETLADWAPKTKDIGFLTEQARMSLSRQIMRRYLSKQGTLSAITLHPNLENEITNNLKQTPEGEQLVLDPAKLQRIIQSIQEELKKSITEEPVILCSPRTRRHIQNLMMQVLPQIGVLSYNEITSDIEVRSVGMVMN
ncbi:MAG: flagellar biosynthesis protein FlhA [bacterium]|nr:flagellar biosynthesis protein FlhA [bacterium]